MLDTARIFTIVRLGSLATSLQVGLSCLISSHSKIFGLTDFQGRDVVVKRPRKKSYSVLLPARDVQGRIALEATAIMRLRPMGHRFSGTKTLSRLCSNAAQIPQRHLSLDSASSDQ